MPKKRIFTVDAEFPGEDFEYVPFDSDQSLLDADVVRYALTTSERSSLSATVRLNMVAREGFR